MHTRVLLPSDPAAENCRSVPAYHRPANPADISSQLNSKDRQPRTTQSQPPNFVSVGSHLLLIGLLAGCQPGNWSNQVELVTSSPAPGMTFELRFQETMVDVTNVGLTTNCPLIISPRLEGTFTWTSPRSGVFSPTQPLALDTHYSLTLNPAFKRVDGRPVNARLRHTLSTPPLAIIASSSPGAEPSASCEPEIVLGFNADVDASAVQPSVTFRDAMGRTIAADVCQGIESCRDQLRWGSSLRTWREQFAVADERAAYHPTNPVPNIIIAIPRTRLPIGAGWRLVLNRGLPALEKNLALRERVEIPIGDVVPFKATEATARNLVHSGASINVTFSKKVSEAVTNTARNWIELSPAPTNLIIKVVDRVVTLSGDLRAGTTYEVKLNRGLPAVEPFTLNERQTLSVTVAAVPPRLYFANFSADQLSSGNRVLPLLGINVSEFRLRAKLLEPNTALYALRGFGSYVVPSEESRSSEEPFRALNYQLVPGRTIYDEPLRFNAAADCAERLELQWDRILGRRTNGVLFVEAQAVRQPAQPKLGTQALVQLTDLGLVCKRGGGAVEVFVFSYSNARPLAGATVRLSTDENQVLSSSVTDADGLAHLVANTNGSWISAQYNEDFHARPLRGDRLWPRDVYVSDEDSECSREARKVLLFSDRDVYRPGDIIFLKAIVRDWTDQGLAIPAATGKLSLYDARNNAFLQTNVLLSASGSLDLRVRLPASPRGTYRARLQVGGTDQTYEFEVQDFEPNSFEVHLGARPEYGPGEKLEVPVTARNYFGKSVTRARVNWYFNASRTWFYPSEFREFSFCRNEDWRFGRSWSKISRSGQGMITAGTNFVISPDLALDTNAPGPRSSWLLAEVTDVNQQTISQKASFVQHSSDFYLGLRQKPGKAPAFDAIAVRNDGEPWPGTVKARMRLQRIEWQSVRIQGAGRTLRYHNEPVVTNLVAQSVEILPVQKVPRGAQIEATSLPVPTDLLPGEYHLELSAEDEAMRPVISSWDFNVSGPGVVAWAFRDGVHLNLERAKDTYTVGEVADITIEAPFGGTALVTVEREKVLRSFVTRLDGNAPSIKIPLQPGDVPNVFVSVTLIRGVDECTREVKEPEYRFGYCELPVTDPETRLSVEITTSASKYLPAQLVESTLQITDHRGLPVSDAEVTLFAVDEGILSLSGFSAPDPHSYFYAARDLGVFSTVSLAHLLSEDSEEWNFENKGYLGGGGGKMETRVRKNFLPCAFWHATLRSDTQGKAKAGFKAPDSLTRYRLMAVANHEAKRFGSSEAAFEVFKPLIIEPALPSFANVSDSMAACAIVRNQTGRAGEVVVSLQLDQHATPGDRPLTQHIQVGPKGNAVVQFPIKFVAAGRATWVWKASFAEPVAEDETDAVQTTLTVGHSAPRLHGVVISRIGKAQTNLLAAIDPQLLAGQGTLTVTIANTRLSELGEAAAKLLHYPYGCVEQTSSRLLPWIVLRQTPFITPSLHATNELDTPVEAGIKRLFSMQTDSGGLGYWPGAREPMLWGSAYAGLVLAFAKQHDNVLPEKEYARLLTYLGKQLRCSPVEDNTLEDRCLALYALAAAGRPESALQMQLFTRRQRLSADHRSLLALAMIESQGPAEMIRSLLEPQPRPGPGEHAFSSSARTKALRLLALTRLRPEDRTSERAVDDLMREQADGHWQTTQGDAWALLALTEYAKRVESKSASAACSLSWSGLTHKFQLNQSNQTFTTTINFTNLTQPLLLVNSSDAPVYSTVSIVANPANIQQPRLERGFSLQRWYDRLDDFNQPQGTANLRVGDRVLVTVRLQVPRDSSYVVVDDALPSILEAVHPEFKTQETTSSPLRGSHWMMDFRELRTDRCLSFANSVRAGDYVWRYLARVRAAGTVTAPAAKVEEMYHPDRFGLSETSTLTSAEMN